MIRFSTKAPMAIASLCLALYTPTRTFAQSEATQKLLENSAGKAGVVTSNSAGTSEVQLLDEDEIAALSRRNQNPGPEVRGGLCRTSTSRIL